MSYYLNIERTEPFVLATGERILSGVEKGDGRVTLLVQLTDGGRMPFDVWEGKAPYVTGCSREGHYVRDSRDPLGEPIQTFLTAQAAEAYALLKNTEEGRRRA